jgi:hypothetical protein
MNARHKRQSRGFNVLPASAPRWISPRWISLRWISAFDPFGPYAAEAARR